MPPVDAVTVAQAPAQPDGPAVRQSRKVDQPAADIAQCDAPDVDLGNAVLQVAHELAQLLLARGHLLGMLGAAVGLAFALKLGLNLGYPVAVVAQLLEHGSGVAQE